MWSPEVLDAAMAEALAEADAAAAQGDVPVGAVLVTRDGSLVARAHNERERAQDPTAHAEVVVLREAARLRGRWRLDDLALVVTLEPCPMCAGALVAARVPLVCFGADDPKAGAVRSLYRLCEDPRLNHRVAVVGGVRSDDARARLQAFFATRRG